MAEKSLIEEVTEYTSESEKLRKESLAFWKRKGGSYFEQPHNPFSESRTNYDKTDFETPFGKLRKFIREKIRGRERF